MQPDIALESGLVKASSQYEGVSRFGSQGVMLSPLEWKGSFHNGQTARLRLQSADMDDSYMIQISSDLVNKLARDGQGQKRRVKKSKPKIPEVPHRHQSKSSSPPAAPKSGSSGAWPVQAPVFFPVPPPTAPATAAVAELEAIRSVLQQSEGVLKKLEQQEANVTLELTQRAKELRDKEFKLPYQKSMPCETERAFCRQCYQENSKQPLKCAQVVRSYGECARRARRRLQPQQVNS